MAQRQFRTDDTSVWADRFGTGSDGAYSPGTTTDVVALATATGTAGTTSVTIGAASTFSNGDLVLIHQTQSTTDHGQVWELNKISSGGGTTSLTMAYNLINTYGTPAQIYQLKQYTTVNIGGGVTYSARTWDGAKGGIVAFLALQSITVSGTISANGAGFAGGAGGLVGVNRTAFQGDSAYANGTRSPSSTNGPGGGGGANTDNEDSGGGGGGGGHNTAGTAGTNGNGNPSTDTLGGQAGQSGYGYDNATVMVFGGGGGGGGIDDSTSGGVGGNSGGIVILIAPDITVSGSVTANGSNGTSHGDSGGGGGGGSGGAVLIKGQRVSLGTTLVTVAGGSGASGNSAFGGIGGNGGNGGYGRIHVDYSQTLSGTTTNPSLDTSVDTVLNDLPNLQNYTLLM